MTLDRVLSVVSLVLGLVCAYEARRLWTGWGGAGLMPAFAAVHFLFVTVAFGVLAGRTNSRFVLPTTKELRSIAIVAASFGAYIGLLDVVGYLFGTWALLAVVVRFTSKAGTRVAIVWPGVLAVGSYLLFGKALGTHLPTGVLGF